ncbi:hypothetical protein NDU88_002643 [Pleurodeles waltl]|uniref:Uncharacterized protein n=1 Tax=Pleurodeles waltl TaxID=8319 RepID=A0AAV7RCL6_PLEWA|nr:hypothetical protein NDU88_002643 [Pleurodeles waltl]
MRRLLRTLGAGRHPDARASFFLSPLAELLPRDGEKRRKARQRSRKGRPQPESARETGRTHEVGEKVGEKKSLEEAEEQETAKKKKVENSSEDAVLKNIQDDGIRKVCSRLIKAKVVGMGMGKRRELRIVVRVASDGKEAEQRARGLSSSTAFSASEEERDRKSKIGKGEEPAALLPGCCPGWPDLPTQGLDPVDRKGRGMQKLETGQRGYANGRIMRRLLRTLGAGRHPDARASFFLSPLAELLPRDGEKRRKARQRSRKGRPQPESSRETGRVASDGKEAEQRARGLSSSTAFSASEEERDRKSKIGKKEKTESFSFFARPRNGHERPSLIYRPKLCLSRVLGKRGRGAGRLLPGCCPGWPDLPTQGLDPVDRKGRGMQKLETGQRGYANGRIMRRLLRTLGAGRHPDARASFFLSPLAELLPRDGEKRRKARQRSRKGRPQPESARETGRVASDGKEAEQRARGLSSSTAFSASEEERDRKSKIGKLCLSRVLGKRGRGAGRLLPGCCPGWPDLPTQGLDPVDRKGRGMQKLETGQRGYANGRIMRRLLRTLGAGRHPDARASFFLSPLAELLPRDGEKRRKARQRSRKGRPQPESARETGR